MSFKSSLTHIITTIIAVVLVGCGPQYQQVSYKSWVVGNCKIHEKISKSALTWPDPTFLRNYWFERDGDNFNIGSYENESSVGVKNAPFAVEEYIVILTSSHVFRIGQKNVNEFSPSMAIQSHNFFEKNRINVHYDYTAESVDKVDSIWKLTYVLNNTESEDLPKVIHFVTKDNWQSFQIDK